MNDEELARWKELERFKADEQIRVEDHKAARVLMQQRHATKHDTDREQRLLLMKGVLDFALASMRILLLINGGALVALLALIGSVWGGKESEGQIVALALQDALWAFGAGVVACVMVPLCSYVSQYLYLRPPGAWSWKRRLGRAAHLFAFAMAFISLCAFAVGAIATARTFQSPLPEAPDGQARSSLVGAAQEASPEANSEGAGATDETNLPKLAGDAVALGGGTIVVEGHRLRLWGIDAPEMDDPRGPVSRAAIDALLRQGAVDCTIVDEAGSSRPVARCSVPGQDGPQDLGEAQLVAGMPFVDRTFALGTDWGARYDAAERRAIEAGAGFWQRPTQQDRSDGFRGLVEDFQVLIAGAFALATAAAIWFSGKRTADATRDLAAQSAENAREDRRARQETDQLRDKLDLFDRRLAVYDAAQAVCSIRRGDLPDDALSRLFAAQREARFLFTKEVAEYIEKLWRKAGMLVDTQEKLKAARGEPPQHLVSRKTELKEWLQDQPMVIHEKLHRFLDLTRSGLRQRAEQIERTGQTSS